MPVGDGVGECMLPDNVSGFDCIKSKSDDSWPNADFRTHAFYKYSRTNVAKGPPTLKENPGQKPTQPQVRDAEMTKAMPMRYLF